LSDEAEDWRWVDVDGAQKPIDEWELISSLSTGALPAYTLVWRAGWAQWLPACQVGELSSAVPGEHRETAVEPEVDEARTEAPPPPLEKYERYRTRQAASQLLGSRRPPHAATVPPPPPLAGSSAGRGATAAASLMGKAAGTPPPPPPPPPARRPMPTLIEQPTAASSMTLRPPGAVPPPPRGVPARPRISSIPEEPKRVASPVDTPIPEIAIREAEAEDEAEIEPEAAEGADAAPQAGSGKPEAEPAGGLEALARTQESAGAPPGLAEAAASAEKAAEPSTPASEPPTAPRATAPLAPRASGQALPSWSAELDAASEPRVSPGPSAAAPAPAPATPAGGARFPVALVLLGALALVLGVVVIVLLATRSNKLNPLRTADGVGTPAATGSASPRRACTLSLPAHRLARSILRSIPPYIASTPDGSRVAIGVAASRTSALGLLVGPSTLSVARAFARNSHNPLLGVVPTTASGKIGFAVTRSDGPLGFARTVDAKPRFVLGMSDAGFARVVGNGQPEVLWPGGTGERMTEIRVATTPSGEHAVAFRRGGQTGQVLVGWLGPGGARKSPLSSVSGGRFLGTPMVAANKKNILVVFASRDDGQAGWGVRLATAANGKAPSGSQEFAIPAGGPGDQAISPAAAGLDDDHWLLQWTEGSRGHHEVRVQPLHADLAPAGPPITVSPKEANAGQGVVWVRGGKAISLFLITQGRRLELWGAALSCP